MEGRISQSLAAEHRLNQGCEPGRSAPSSKKYMIEKKEVASDENFICWRFTFTTGADFA